MKLHACGRGAAGYARALYPYAAGSAVAARASARRDHRTRCWPARRLAHDAWWRGTCNRAWRTLSRHYWPPSPNNSGRGGSAITQVTFHTTEGAQTGESLGNWVCDPASQVSYHSAVDNTEPGVVFRYVDTANKAWAQAAGNPFACSVAFCTPSGAASGWNSSKWLSMPWMLDNAAAIAKTFCNLHGIPVKKLNNSQAQNGERGISQHLNGGSAWSNHSDCGSGFLRATNRSTQHAGLVALQSRAFSCHQRSPPIRASAITPTSTRPARSAYGGQTLAPMPMRASPSAPQPGTDTISYTNQGKILCFYGAWAASGSGSLTSRRYNHAVLSMEMVGRNAHLDRFCAGFARATKVSMAISVSLNADDTAPAHGQLVTFTYTARSYPVQRCRHGCRGRRRPGDSTPMVHLHSGGLGQFDKRHQRL